jgi:hypothetical protein
VEVGWTVSGPFASRVSLLARLPAGQTHLRPPLASLSRSPSSSLVGLPSVDTSGKEWSEKRKRGESK